jgi:PKHD-type hydroxylase
VAGLRALLERGAWADGRITAGTQSAQVKNNRQLPEESPEAREAAARVRAALERNALFFTAALPRRIYPPLFNRYGGEANAFGAHVDNAVRTHRATGEHVRTDLSATLFLSDPEDYDGGELVIEEAGGDRAWKLEAGALLLYPGSTVHRVNPVTRGERLASFFWIESMVREPDRRRVLFDLDMSILSLRGAHGDGRETLRLTACYHNLLRMWAHP